MYLSEFLSIYSRSLSLEYLWCCRRMSGVLLPVGVSSLNFFHLMWRGSQCCSPDDRIVPVFTLHILAISASCPLLWLSGVWFRLYTDTSINLHHLSELSLSMISGLLAITVLSMWICWSYRTAHEPAVVVGGCPTMIYSSISIFNCQLWQRSFKTKTGKGN